MASGAPVRRSRCWSTCANPRSSSGSLRSHCNACSTVRRCEWTSWRSRRMSALSMPWGAERQQEVRASRLETAEIDRHVEIADLPERGENSRVPVPLPQLRDVLERDLETSEAVVMADAELTEAEGAQKCLGRVHLVELLGRDAIAVLEA